MLHTELLYDRGHATVVREEEGDVVLTFRPGVTSPRHFRRARACALAQGVDPMPVAEWFDTEGRVGLRLQHAILLRNGVQS